MDELQLFYYKEREGHRDKIFNLESELERYKESMQSQIENLTLQLERAKYTQEYADKLEQQRT